MDPKFLKECEDAGWHLEFVGDDFVVGKCPSVGCGLRAKLDQDRAVPCADPGRRRDVLDLKVGSYDEARTVLRERRETLGLTISEVEELAGATVDHLAKAEKDGPSKVPNAQLLLEWAQALGYEVVLRPTELPALTRRVICDTRDRLEARRKRFRLEGRRRSKRA
jgi:transcriptional regulator with XRE-family HTH domain